MLGSKSTSTLLKVNVLFFYLSRLETLPGGAHCGALTCWAMPFTHG